MVLIVADPQHIRRQMKRGSINFDQRIPLTDVKVKGEMIDFVGHVKIQQTFRNLYPTNIEAIYMFNLDSGSTVMGMKMKIGDRILSSKVAAKSEARQTYETAIAEKKTTCLLEKTSNGIYTVNVGNILANEEVQIEIEYITQLECSDDGEMKFVLPTNISPKYDAPQKTLTDAIATASTTSAMTFTSSRSPFSFEVELQWTSRNSIKEVKSLTNEIRVEGGSDPNTVTIRSETAPSNGDFNVLVTVGEIEPAAYVYETKGGEGEKVEAESFLMVSHRIRDELAEIEGGDFTILVDRSGSMGSSFDNWSGGSGQAAPKTKMDYAREATRLFVQSLPAGCSFNVVSFGSNYESVFKSSERYNNETKERALKAIERFDSNLGGTELYQCLSSVLQGSTSVTKPVIDLSKRKWAPFSSKGDGSNSAIEQKSKKTNEKIVILMTDGDVGNVDAVVGLIRSHRENCRVFTIGIGRDVNRFLCEEVAAASNATCEVMVDNPNISSVVAKMLDAATKSYYKNSTLTLTGAGSGVSRIFIDKPLYANKFLSIFHKLPGSGSGSVETVQLSSEDGMKNETVQWTLPVVVVGRADERGHNLRFLPQLYAADQIKSLEKQIAKNHSAAEAIAEIVRLSVKYGVMNDRTSFVVVDEKENRDVIAPPMPVQVPQYAQSASFSFAGSTHSSVTSATSGGVLFCAAAAPPGSQGFFGGIGSGAMDLFGGLNRSSSTSSSWGGGGSANFSYSGNTSFGSAVPFSFQPPPAPAPAGGAFPVTTMDPFAFNAPALCPPEVLLDQEQLAAYEKELDLANSAPLPDDDEFDDLFSAASAPSSSFASSSQAFSTRQSVATGFAPMDVDSPRNATIATGLSTIVEKLLSFQNADGSFAYHSASMTASHFSSDLLRQYAAEQGLSEELAFNVWVLHLLKKEKSASQYVMIVRKLQLWIEKQLKHVSTSGGLTLTGLLQVVVDKQLV